MLRSRTFRFAVAAVAAAGSGVGVALAAAPGEQTPTFGITLASREDADYRIGGVGQSANVRPIGGQLDQGDGEPPIPLRILCPVDQVSDCDAHADLYYEKLPPGQTTTTYTATSVVTSTVLDAGTTTTSTATIPAAIRGQAMPATDLPGPVDFGAVPVGGTSAPVTIAVTNDADADYPLTFEDLVVDGATDQFAVVASDCDEIPAGGACEIAIAFRPTRTGPVQSFGALRFWRAMGDAEFDLEANGTPAVPPTTVTETQTQTQTVTTPAPPPVTVTTPGRTVTVTVPGTPPPAQCVVPALKGKSQTSARRALEKAACALGKVTRPKRGTGLVVASQTVRAGVRRSTGTKVGVRLAPRARTARRR